MLAFLVQMDRCVSLAQLVNSSPPLDLVHVWRVHRTAGVLAWHHLRHLNVCAVLDTVVQTVLLVRHAQPISTRQMRDRQAAKTALRIRTPPLRAQKHSAASATQDILGQAVGSVQLAQQASSRTLPGAAIPARRALLTQSLKSPVRPNPTVTAALVTPATPPQPSVHHALLPSTSRAWGQQLVMIALQTLGALQFHPQ